MIVNRALTLLCRQHSDPKMFLRAFLLTCSMALLPMGHVNAQQIELAVGRTLVVDTLQLLIKVSLAFVPHSSLKSKGHNWLERTRAKKLRFRKKKSN